MVGETKEITVGKNKTVTIKRVTGFAFLSVYANAQRNVAACYRDLIVLCTNKSKEEAESLDYQEFVQTALEIIKLHEEDTMDF